MKFTFLGTAAANAFPEPFCNCANCQQARRLGGPSLRRRAAALIDDRLLLDLGPDVLSAANFLGIDLTRVRYCLQTHAHADHLDPSHLLSRSPGYGVLGAPRLQFCASLGSIDRLSRELARDCAPLGLLHPETLATLNLEIYPLQAGQRLALGPYQVAAFAANHDPQVEPLLYAIRADQGSILYATDTAEFPAETWQALTDLGWIFDLVVLDHTYGPQERSSDHLSAREVAGHVTRMRAAGLIAPAGRAFATHIAHEGNPAHPDLVAYASQRGYEIAYDGLRIEL